MKQQPTTEFEYEVCSRCGGEGRYSFNMMDMDRCYGCNGTGYKLTKRGQAARALFIKMISKPAAEIVAGEKIYREGHGAGWYTVESVTSGTGAISGLAGDFVNITMSAGANITGWVVRSNELVRYAQTPEQRAEKLAAALTYQGTLAKTGKPRKVTA